MNNSSDNDNTLHFVCSLCSSLSQVLYMKRSGLILTSVQEVGIMVIFHSTHEETKAQEG